MDYLEGDMYFDDSEFPESLEETPDTVEVLSDLTDDDIRLYAHMYMPKEAFRPFQLEAIVTAVRAYLDHKKYVILESPVGSGKSVIGYVIAKIICGILNRNEQGLSSGVALTKLKLLQVQYLNDFPDMASLWSATGYACHYYPGDPEAHYGGYNCKKQLCPGYESCDYKIAKERFFSTELGVTNYHFYLQAKMVKKVLVLDEAHNLEDLLCEYATIKIHPSSTEKLLEDLKDFLLNPDVIDQIVNIFSNMYQLPVSEHWLTILRRFASLLFLHVREVLAKLKLLIANNIHSNNANQLEQNKYFKRCETHLKLLERRLSLLTTVNTPWILNAKNVEEGSCHIKPLYATKFAQDMFRRTKFVLFMSGTICGHEEFTQSLGIKEDEYVHIEIPSTFPVENRQVYSIKNVALNYRNKLAEIPKFVHQIDTILDRLRDTRGLIHSVSYENAELVTKLSRHTARMIVPESSDLLIIKDVLMQRTDTILVSPTILEGLDLIEDLCRVQFFLKVPYLYLGDKWVEERMHQSSAWYARKAVINILQGSGRGVRTHDDFCETIILDGAFRNLFNRNKHLFPQYFTEALVLWD